MATAKTVEIPKILVINAETNEVFERELTPEEVAEHKEQLATILAQKAAQEAKAAARASALAKLAELGLTEEEIAAL